MSEFVIPHRLKLNNNLKEDSLISCIYIGEMLSNLIECFTKDDDSLAFEIGTIGAKLLNQYNEFLFSDFSKPALRGEKPIAYFLGVFEDRESVLSSIYEHIKNALMNKQLLELLDKHFAENSLQLLLYIQQEKFSRLIKREDDETKKLVSAVFMKKFVLSSQEIPFQNRQLAQYDLMGKEAYISSWENLNKRRFFYTIFGGNIEAVSQHFYINNNEKKTPISNVVSCYAYKRNEEWYLDVKPRLRTWAVKVHDKNGKLKYQDQTRTVFFRSKRNNINLASIRFDADELRKKFLPIRPAMEEYLNNCKQGLIDHWNEDPKLFLSDSSTPSMKMVLQKEERSDWEAVKSGASLADRYWLFQLLQERLTDLSFPMNEYTISKSPGLSTLRTDGWDMYDKRDSIELTICVLGDRTAYKLELPEALAHMFSGREIKETIEGNKCRYVIEIDEFGKSLVLNFDFQDNNELMADMPKKERRVKEIEAFLTGYEVDAAIIAIEDFRVSKHKRKVDPKETLRKEFAKKGIGTQFFHPGEINKDTTVSLLRDLLCRYGLRNNLYSLVSDDISNDNNVYITINRYWEKDKETKESKLYFDVILTKFDRGVLKFFVNGMSDFKEFKDTTKEALSFQSYTEEEFEYFIKELSYKKNGYIIWPKEYQSYLDAKNAVYIGQSKGMGMTVISSGDVSKGTTKVQHGNQLLYQPKKMPNKTKIKETTKDKDNQQFENKIPIEFTFADEVDEDLADYLYKMVYLNPTSKSEATVKPLPLHFHKYIRELM